MTEQMTTWAALLLADPSPGLRRLVLRELLGRAQDDDEVRELAALREDDPRVSRLLALQDPDGGWPGLEDGSRHLQRLRYTSLALSRLGYLGFGPGHPAVARGAEFLFSLQREDGSWPMPREADEGEGYSMMPVQTALPLAGLAFCGFGQDARAEAAYEWLLDKRLPDGAWPTGTASRVRGRTAGYRRLAHSRWGCRSNTTAALVCLAHHPQRRRSPAAQGALDLLLGRETREARPVGFEIARLIGFETARGFLTFHARFDLALLLDLCWRLGASTSDERVEDAAGFVRRLQGPNGLWRYDDRPAASRWVTFDLLRSLSRLDGSTKWIGLEPRTPFRPYAPGQRRY